MADDDRVIELLAEIRDIQRAHLEAYRNFTGKITAQSEQDTDRSVQLQQAYFDDAKKNNKRATLSVITGMAIIVVVITVLSGVVAFAALENLGFF